MTGVEMILAGPLGRAIGWALVHLLWQGVLVAAILAATLALLQRQSANARYLASCGALILLVALGIATGYRAYDPAASPVMPAAVAAYIDDSPHDATTGEPQVSAAEAPASASTMWQNLFVSAVTIANAHLAQIVAIWLAGVVILSARLIVGWIGAHRLTTRRSHAASDQWIQSLNRMCDSLRLRRSIALLESAAVEVPTVIGWLRPAVLLPVASLSGLSIQQIEMVLAHELAHIRRHDFIVNLLQSVIETLLFYHPAVWWISGRIRTEREHCCDDLAVAVFGDPVQYARALTRFEELRLDAQSVVAANGGSLIERIHRLVLARAESANWSSRWAAGAALISVVAVMLIAPALPLFANREQQTPQSTPAPAPAAPDKMKVKEKECDKTDATIEVDASDTVDVESDRPESDDSSDEPPMAPMAVVHPVIAPHVRIAPMAALDIDRIVSDALGQVDVTLAPERQRRRHRIGEGGRLSVDDLIALRTAGVDPKYIEEMRASGISDLSLDDLVAMRIQGVTPTYIKEMASAGYPKLTAHELISMKIQGVSPKYVADLANAGYKNLAAQDLVSMRIQGVNSDFVKSLADAGYANLSPKELIRLRVSGVDANFIRELSKYRTK
ncbi:MAG TPA: M56 family metallopeptidase [Thermoanaerobaculia bacterium]